MHIKDRTFIISGGASGLALACARDIHELGGYVSLLDLNTDSGDKVIEELGPRRARFFECDVSETDSIAQAVAGTIEWVKQTEKPLGGVIAGAGVGNPGLVSTRVSRTNIIRNQDN
jgi:NAD(P)-dependent dehydrogenase (short-subunit alcohol dehydrogenase family)